MEPSTVTPGQQKLPFSFDRLLETIRGRFTTTFSGSSVIRSRHKAATPRIGLRLLSGNPDTTAESHSPTSHASRNDSLTGAVIDTRISLDETLRSCPPAHIALGPRSAPEERHHTRRAGARRVRTARGRRRYPQAAWVRPAREPLKISGTQRFCLGTGLRTKEARRKIIDCAVSAALLSVVLVICRPPISCCVKNLP